MTGSPVPAKTVVIADDTGFVRDRFKAALEDAGHRSIVVRSAVELLARVRADLDRIDLIALDLRLPNAPGVDLVRAIRKIDGGRLRILVFSGTIASAEEVRELAGLGVVGYINEYARCRHHAVALRRLPTASTGGSRESSWASLSHTASGTRSRRRSR
jgi:CheY-like chemotaxis protein